MTAGTVLRSLRSNTGSGLARVLAEGGGGRPLFPQWVLGLEVVSGLGSICSAVVIPLGPNIGLCRKALEEDNSHRKDGGDGLTV